jgi:hypothetical protein
MRSWIDGYRMGVRRLYLANQAEHGAVRNKGAEDSGL